MSFSNLNEEKNILPNEQVDEKIEPAILSESLKKEIDHWLTKYPPDQRQSAIIPSLLAAQKHNQGWLSLSLITAIANYLKMPHIQAYEVATFYSMLELKPVGQKVICVCTNVSCMLNGSDDIVEYFKKHLDLRFGQTTTDKRFTLKEVECLGACINAPVISINGRYHEKITLAKLDEILNSG